MRQLTSSQLMQFMQRRAEDRLRIAPHLDDTALIGLADEVAVLLSPTRAAPASPRCVRGSGTWITGAELFVEQRAQRQLAAPRADLRGPVFESPYSARWSLMPSPSVTSRSRFG